MSAQCPAADKKANGTLAMIKRGAERKSEHVVMVLCQSMLDNLAPPAPGAEQGAAPRAGVAGTPMQGHEGAFEELQRLRSAWRRGDMVIFLFP